MHFVDRGPEPGGLKAYRDKHTPKWVRHYAQGTGQKPDDAHWRKFHAELEAAFCGLCGYCEIEVRCQIDHFRPKSRFPERVYQWSNLVYACATCNIFKSEKWPRTGYVDPCARTRTTRPEEYFTFDTKTGEILPRDGLPPPRRQRALTMIRDLKLNGMHLLKARLRWVRMIAEVLWVDDPTDSQQDSFVQHLAARDCRFSSIARVFLTQRGYRVS